MTEPVIRITWKPPFEELIRHKGDRLAPALMRILDALAMEGEAFAKKSTPVDTGRLQASITWSRLPNPMARAVGTNVSYAPFILGDVKPFIIRARNKKALAWVVYRGGRSKAIRPASDDVQGWRRLKKRGLAAYAKWVCHPGGRDVFGKTADHLIRRAPSIVARILKAEEVT